MDVLTVTVFHYDKYNTHKAAVYSTKAPKDLKILAIAMKSQFICASK
jgi:hypothetical protein